MRQDVQPALVEGVDHVPHALARQSDVGRDPWGMLPGGTCQDDLRPSQDEGVGTVQAIVQRRALLVGERTHVNWMGLFHTLSISNIKTTVLSKQ